MRFRKCRNCEEDYVTVVEEDYTGECSDCEDLPLKETMKNG